MSDLGSKFRALHQPGNPFILANAWDIGSAKMLAGLGAQALGTSSAAHAFTLGRPDMGNVTRDEALTHAQDMIAAVQIPIQGDFENGFGDDPETCAETVRLSAEIGLAGICIEDTMLPSDTPYDIDLAVERIRAAAAAARALPHDFVLTARADGLMLNTYDIDEAIQRLQAFEQAGADCLYAPVPKSMADLARICRETTKPVNALIAGYTDQDLDQFAKIGVARVSLGSALARATHRVITDSMTDMIENGGFTGLGRTISGDKVDAFMTNK
ncbi:isocitrate lyase/phosphoenolpyruvate mutase family protein [Aestuariibius sp. HNIBRBA575]|uniref:isocitrate lyase/PEP mutase family protein n=1 Tax=Aestuariibius sp. HNIBRBA575 TaxID=3233343 RepID=UPI0034A31EFD